MVRVLGEYGQVEMYTMGTGFSDMYGQPLAPEMFGLRCY